MPRVNFDAEPAPLSVELDRAALVIIDISATSSIPAVLKTASVLTGPGEVTAATPAE
jgi:hypothetical protein